VEFMSNNGTTITPENRSSTIHFFKIHLIFVCTFRQKTQWVCEILCLIMQHVQQMICNSLVGVLGACKECSGEDRIKRIILVLP
jgi:hypothetical protein